MRHRPFGHLATPGRSGATHRWQGCHTAPRGGARADPSEQHKRPERGWRRPGVSSAREVRPIGNAGARLIVGTRRASGPGRSGAGGQPGRCPQGTVGSRAEPARPVGGGLGSAASAPARPASMPTASTAPRVIGPARPATAVLSTGPARAEAWAAPAQAAGPAGVVSTVSTTSRPSRRQAASRAPLAAARAAARRQAASSPSSATRAPARAARSAADWARCRATIAAPMVAIARATAIVTAPAARTQTVAEPASLRQSPWRRPAIRSPSTCGWGRGPGRAWEGSSSSAATWTARAAGPRKGRAARGPGDQRGFLIIPPARRRRQPSR